MLKTWTADTISDFQIKLLRKEGERLIGLAFFNEDADAKREAFDILRCSAEALARNLDASDGNGTWRGWRKRCARWLNNLGARFA